MSSYRDRIAQLSTALADATRREIYEYLYQEGEPLGAKEVAERFGLHVNAARMHLEKLAKGGLLTVVRKRGAQGGRPAHLYQVNEEDWELNVPPRRYRLLAEIMAEVLGGHTGRLKQSLLDAAYRRGRQEAMDRASPLRQSIGEDAHLLAQAWEEDLRERGIRNRCRVLEGRAVEATLMTCPFGGLAGECGEFVCEVHRSYEEGRLSVTGNWRLGRETANCVFLAQLESERG